MDSIANDQLFSSTICLIDNFGCIRSSSNEISYHCFIQSCTHDTSNLGDLIEHLACHTQKWLGFCYACDEQIYEKKTLLLAELLHWHNSHKSNGSIVRSISVPCHEMDKLRQIISSARNERFGRLISDTTLCDDDHFGLKPWSNSTLKTRENCRKMLHKMCLYAMYKCMAVNCSFFTSSTDEMLAHLRHHERSSDSDSRWLECSYCNLTSDSCSSLIEHIASEHRSSLYQCSACFYRSCSAHNVLLHSSKFHELHDAPPVVLVCHGKPSFVKDIQTVIEENRSKYVFPIRCYDVCRKKTFALDVFMKHVKTSSDHDGNHFKCQFCGLSIPLAKAKEHLSIHNIGVYQCIYCVYGTDSVRSIQDHVCHTHPNELPLTCVRLSPKDQILRDDDQSIVAKLSETVDYKWLEKCPFTQDQLSNGSLVQATSNLRPTSASIENCGSWSTDYSNGLSIDAMSTASILSYRDLIKDYAPDDWNEYFAMLLTSSRAECTPDGEMDPLIDSTTFTDEDSVRNAHESIDQSGFKGFEEVDVREFVYPTHLKRHVATNTNNNINIESHNEAVQIGLDAKIQPDVIEIDMLESDPPLVTTTSAELTETRKQITFAVEDVGNIANPQKASESERNPDAKQRPTKRKRKYEISQKELNRLKSGNTFAAMIDEMVQNAKLSDVFKYRCAYCPKSFENHALVYDHFRKDHAKPKTVFMFKVAKIFHCYYCRHFNSYDDLKRHCDQKHSRQLFIMMDKFNPTKCGLCAESMENISIVDHFEINHSSAGVTNAIGLENYLTDELLNKIAAEQLVTPKADQIMFGCPICPTSRHSDQMELVKHLREHFVEYQCKFCDKRFNRIETLQRHHRVHGKRAETFSVADAAIENFDKYLEMKIYFPNGLVLTKRELKKTKFGDMDEVKEWVKEIGASDVSSTAQKRRPDAGEDLRSPPALPKLKRFKLGLKKIDNQVPVQPAQQTGERKAVRNRRPPKKFQS